MKPVSLEKRIATALTQDIKSADLATLIADVEDAIVAAGKAVEQARVRALDPSLLDPSARTALQNAEFLAQRLQVALPRLGQRLEGIQAAEYAAQWEADYEMVKVKRDEWARKYSEYPKLKAPLIDLLRGAEEIDKEVSRINGAAPSGEHRRLLEVELTARGLERFTREDPSIANELRLPSFEHSDRTVWPPPRVFDQSMFEPVPYDPRYSPDWGLVQEEERREARERAEREAKEREAKKLENYHGPRWWERPTG
jgi:hypothetical protein